ncbi:MAG: A/G-specific adenine glycosylase [Meiothermus sp.]
MDDRGFIVGSELHTSLQKEVLEWYYQHKRNLPWRGETDPYRILLSEILLQQTRVDQAIPYYRRFLAEFPTLEALGKTELEAVLKVWQGIGYYARARNLHKLAQTVVGVGGELPRTYDELLKLPGLGPYTAAAVASIAFGEPVAAVDGNVRRVLSRWMAWENPSLKQVQDKADEVLASESLGDWNQAMMELGATVCMPKNPRCSVCPVAQFCQGKTSPERYPAAKQRSRKSVDAVALVLVGPDGIHLEMREGRVLGGLWGFPMEEGEGALEKLLGRFGLESANFIGTVQHAFTHRKLTIQVYRASWDGREQPENRPLSRLDRKILELVQKPQSALFT